MKRKKCILLGIQHMVALDIGGELRKKESYKMARKYERNTQLRSISNKNCQNLAAYKNQEGQGFKATDAWTQLNSIFKECHEHCVLPNFPGMRVHRKALGPADRPYTVLPYYYGLV